VDLTRSILSLVPLAVAAPACGSIVGEPCTLSGGVGQADVLYEQAAPGCDDEVCLSLDGAPAYCTTPCSGGDDCPDGYSCRPIDLSPTPGVENLADLCVDDSPPVSDDDDTALPSGCTEGQWGTPPVLSNLVIVPEPAGDACNLRLEVDWQDAEGDLNAADSLIRFDEVQFDGIFEVEDATVAHLVLTVPLDGALATLTAYDVSVKIRDRGCNWSNVLEQQGYVTPDEACQQVGAPSAH